MSSGKYGRYTPEEIERMNKNAEIMRQMVYERKMLYRTEKADEMKAEINIIQKENKYVEKEDEKEDEKEENN